MVRWAWIAVSLAVACKGKSAAPPAVDLTCAGGRCPAFDPAAGATLVVAGTGSALDGVRIEVPPGAVRERVELGVALAATAAGPRPDLAVGPTLRFAPDGTRFAKLVRVRMPLARDAKVQPSDKVVVGIASTWAGSSRWDLVLPRAVDVDAGWVTVRMRHFSDATPMRIGGDGGLLLVEDDRVIERPLATVTSATFDAAAECGTLLEGLGPLDETWIEWSYEQFSGELDVGGYATLGIPGTRTIDDVAAIGFYLDAEDGGAISIAGQDIAIPPLRTGYEVGLYERIKRQVAANPDTPITPELMLEMALLAMRDGGGRPNAQLAMLTVITVVRILARPQQWTNDLLDASGKLCPPENPQCGRTAGHTTYGHPPDDLAFPIFMDLLDVRPSGGSETLPDLLRRQGRLGATPGAQWSMGLFSPPGTRGNTGIFTALPDTTDALDNAGSHYYYWTGALGRAALGPELTVLGIAKEKRVKDQDGLARPGQGKIQAGNALRGFQLAACLELLAPKPKSPSDAGLDATAADATPADALPADAGSADAPRSLARWVGTWEGTLLETETSLGKTATRRLPAEVTMTARGDGTLVVTPAPALNLPPATIAVDVADDTKAFVDGPAPPHLLAQCKRTGSYAVDAVLTGDELGLTVTWIAETTCQLAADQPAHTVATHRVLTGALARKR